MCGRINKINFFFILLLIPGLISTTFLGAQEDMEVKAIQLFNAGNFNEAEKIFYNLLKQNPDNPMSNYYYGASRTENGHYGDRELHYLNLAGKIVTPDRLNYYLGIQYHARENWTQALKYYNQFRLSVPVIEQQELELDKKIQLCFNQNNPFKTDTTFSEQQISQSGNPSLENKLDTLISEKIIKFSASTEEDILADEMRNEVDANNGLILPREALPDLPGVKHTLPEGEPVQFQVNGAITYLFTSQFQTEKGKSQFELGQKLKMQQEKNLNETGKLRKEYKNSQNSEEREAIAQKIISLENESFYLEEKIKSAFTESRNTENAFWEEAGPVARKNFLTEQENILLNMEENNEVAQEDSAEILINLFDTQPKASAKSSPADLVYKIQIGAYSKGIPAYRQRIHKKLSVIRTIENYTDEKGVVVYTTGNLNRYEDALKLQGQVKQEGIQDALVVPYYNGKRITLEQAKQLEANNDI